MSSKDAHLYHVPQPAKQKSGKEITSSGGLAFSSQLTALISTSKSNQSDRVISGRVHKKKDDIFSTHNRNSAKRAKKDLESNNHDTPYQRVLSSNNDTVDGEILDRSRRKMEEKARLYAAMKRGDVDDHEGKHMVDFDRKWVESNKLEWNNESGSDSYTSDQDYSVSQRKAEEMIEWTDEYGRTRKGTKSQLDRDQRRKDINADLEDSRARPQAPSQIIYGDAVQSAAFNPDEIVADRMADLAAKRDKELTPPPDMHFDSSKEVRSKGVGFMQFSLDADERQKQMEALKQERTSTMDKRNEKDDMLDDRKRKLEERRRLIREAKDKLMSKQAS